jgi:hypothetical protein
MVVSTGTVAKLVTAFVMLIIGISLIGVVATQTTGVTARTTTTETFNVAPARLVDGDINTTYKFYPAVTTAAATSWRADTDGCQVNDVILGSFSNASGTAYTATTDYVTNSAGYFTLVNSSTVFYSTNSTTGVFPYCADGYTTQGWGRSILNLVPGFFALALMAIALGLFYSLGRDAGIL